MEIITFGYIVFIVMSIIGTIFQFWAWKIGLRPKQTEKLENPNFISFQRKYLTAYLPAVVGDWMQGPYLYALYRNYGFTEDQIAIIYVSGFVSAIFLGTFVSVRTQKYRPHTVLIFSTLVYAISSLLKISTYYSVLIAARGLSGIATPIMFQSFDTWYVTQHVQTYDFPKEWIEITSAKIAFYNGLLAIACGVIANTFTEWFNFGPVFPFIIAAPCLLISSLIILKTWSTDDPPQEDKSTNKKHSFILTIRELADQPDILALGCVEALFESAMAIFIFVWTPVLMPAGPSLGITFSTFMVCVLLGGTFYELLVSKHYSLRTLLIFSTGISCAGFTLSSIYTVPNYVYRSFVLLGLLFVEFGAGIYFPVMTELRRKLLPESHYSIMRSIFCIPLNIIACIALCSLHNDSWRHGNKILLIISAFLLLIALLVSLKIKVKNVDNNEQNLSTSNC